MPVVKRLSSSWYTSTEVTALARDLLGKFLVTTIGDIRCSGMIIETEAYRGPDDRACHAFNHRRTPRTEVMFATGGVAYIYVCYGMHHLMNVVTGPKDHAHAILIRALQPAEGLEHMAKRRQMPASDIRITKGPGALSVAMGLTSALSGISLTRRDSPLWIEDRGIRFATKDIGISRRIGVESAGDAATWPWRYFLKENRHVSAHRRSLIP